MPRQLVNLLLMLAYGLAFWLTLGLAAHWGGKGFYSVWFPAAGLRLALLWHAGPRFTPAIAAVEILVNLAMGRFSITSPDLAMTLWGILRPVLAYGGVVALIRWLSSGRRAGVMAPPMPFSLAAVAAPGIAAFSALPEALLRPDRTAVESIQDVMISLTAFAVGDLLGVLIVAPPLLWVAETMSQRRIGMIAALRECAIRGSATLEVALLLAGGIATTWLLNRIGLGSQPMPLILAVAWVGLRFGRFPVWMALTIVSILVLPETAGAFSTTDRLHLHLDLATVVVVGYLAGSYCDAQKEARTDIERRDRLLFQAERLKTLRAMSVAVIHEISQPLSTLAIEAKHLHQITGGADDEIMRSAALVDRKAATLSNLVRRLRRFGGAAVDEPSALPVSALIESVAAIAAPEARDQGASLKLGPIDPDLVVFAQEVELTQALMNLLRNAIHAASDGNVELSGEKEEEMVRIMVTNRVGPSHRAKAGMGVGSLVAQAIVEAHGGHLEKAKVQDGVAHASIILPLAGDNA
ncbi:ATP-binding protein [Sphingobium vermicomposti]|uniref:histidine kinase n=1 Tax=Sphingobium vermicomposti TaxID=529005 RepID=A0A846M368_9SPHN|nr:ATP-binding protein [Sphingobium vermicomposti]NIJ16369.1 signal transduction histidine kinase [Sphingobium vermicomposti]